MTWKLACTGAKKKLRAVPRPDDVDLQDAGIHFHFKIGVL